MSIDLPAPPDFFDESGVSHPELFDGVDAVWEVLPKIKDFAGSLAATQSAGGALSGLVEHNTVLLDGRAHVEEVAFEAGDPTKGGFKVFLAGERVEGAAFVFAGAYILGPEVLLGPGAVVEPGAMIKGPTVIGPGSEVRQGAYLRGAVIVGSGCVVGHATEVKNSLFLNGAKAAHFAYVGDSILGARCNLGAGTRLANLKLRGSNVRVNIKGTVVDTGLRKLGAILGDGVETGCNSVFNPGSLLGPDSRVYPNETVGPGFYPRGSTVSGR